MSIDDIQKEYLPVSKKKIRAFVKKYLNFKLIGGRIPCGKKLYQAPQRRQRRMVLRHRSSEH